MSPKPLRGKVFSITTLSIFGLLLLAGTFADEQFWSLGWLAWLPGKSGLATLAVCLLLLAFPLFYRRPIGLDSSSDARSARMTWVLLPALAMGFVFFFLPMEIDYLGDSLFIRVEEGTKVEKWDSEMLWLLVKPNLLEPKVGTLTNYQINNISSYLFDADWNQSAIFWQLIFGVCFVLVWQTLIVNATKITGHRLALTLAGLSGPALFSFAGHLEIYALPLLINLILAGGIHWAISARNKKLGPVLLLLLFLAIKSHILGWLFFPAVTITLLYLYSTPSSQFHFLFSTRGIITMVLIPAAILGSIVYFFVMKSANGPRAYGQDDLFSAMFLPMVANEVAPLDRYNLFSLNHIFDYAINFFFWSPAALYFGILILHFRPTKQWKGKLDVLLLATTLLLFISAQFVLNPLLSIPFDIDLLSIPFPILLVLLLVLSKDAYVSIPKGMLIIPLLALSIFGLSSYAVNSNLESVRQRYESNSMHIFKTYWIGTSSHFEIAHNTIPDLQERITRKEETLAKLETYAVPTEDHEYAAMIYDLAKLYADSLGDLEQAATLLKKGEYYSPFLSKNILKLVEVNFILGRKSKAYAYSETLIKVAYPNKKRSLQIGIHIAIAAGEAKAAKARCNAFLAEWPDDPFITKVAAGLDTFAQPLDVIKYFKSR